MLVHKAASTMTRFSVNRACIYESYLIVIATQNKKRNWNICIYKNRIRQRNYSFKIFVFYKVLAEACKIFPEKKSR